MDQVDLALGNTEGEYTCAPRKRATAAWSQLTGGMASKAALLFCSRAFLTGDQIRAALSREKGKLGESTLYLVLYTVLYSVVVDYTSLKCYLHILSKQ